MKSSEKQENPLILMHISFLALSVFIMDFITKRQPCANLDNEYFDTLCIIFIVYLIFEFIKLKKIGFKSHIQAISKKALTWYIAIEFIIILISINYIFEALGDEVVVPKLQLAEASFHALLASGFLMFFTFLRFKKKAI